MSSSTHFLSLIEGSHNVYDTIVGQGSKANGAAVAFGGFVHCLCAWRMFLYCCNSIPNFRFFPPLSAVSFFLRACYDAENKGSTESRQRLHLVSSTRNKYPSLTNEADGNKVWHGAFLCILKPLFLHQWVFGEKPITILSKCNYSFCFQMIQLSKFSLVSIAGLQTHLIDGLCTICLVSGWWFFASLSPQVREHLPIYSAGIHEFHSRLNHLQIEQAKLAETLANDQRYSRPTRILSRREVYCVFLTLTFCLPHSCQKMEMLKQRITTIHQHYRKDRQTGSMYLFLLLLHCIYSFCKGSNWKCLFFPFHHRVGI